MKMNAPQLNKSTVSILFSILGAGFAVAVPTVPASWTNASGGTIDGVSFGCGGFAFEQLASANLSGSEYSYSPLSTTETTISYWAGSGSGNQITFANPLAGILVYVVDWNGGPLNGTAATYTLSSDFQVMSGFTNANIQGNTIVVPDGQSASGIIRMRGSVSGFSVSSSEPSDGARNRMTFAQTTILFDNDADGIEDEFETNTGIYVSPQNTGTSPNNPDSDGDGLKDGVEVNTHHTNPNLSDTDADGFSDSYELLTGHSPTDPNDKPSLVAQASPAVELTFSSATGKTYRIEASSDLVAWIAIESGIAGTGSEIQRFYSTKNTSKRFYRVEETSP